MKNIAIIEFNAHHDECMYSQVAFLRASYPDVKLYLVANYHLKERLNYLDEFEDALFVRTKQWGIGYLRVLKFLKKHPIQKVIFNSIPNKPVNRLLSILSKTRRDYYGVVHNVQSFDDAKYRRTFSILNSYYVLNDYLLDGVQEYLSSNHRVESFYPIFFKPYDQIELDKDENEIWITIPGKMELGRRDYLQLLESFKSGKLKSNIKLIFLGRSDHTLRRQFEEYDVQKSCVFWDAYISNQVFHSYLQKSDYILPLLHGNASLLESYRYKISGAFNLAFSYQISMLMDHSFSSFEDFQSTAYFYSSDDDIVDVLNHLERPTQKFNNEKWSFEYQRKKYVRLLQKG